MSEQKDDDKLLEQAKKEAKIIVIDDSEFQRRNIVSILEDNGYNVVGETSSSKEAVQIINQTEANLVIIDIVLPEVNGIEVVRHFNEGFSSIYFITISSLAHEQVIIEAISAGAHDFIQKPFSDSTLLSSVEKLSIQIVKDK